MNSNVMRGIVDLRAEVLQLRGRLWFTRTRAQPILKKGATHIECVALSGHSLSSQQVTNPSAAPGSQPVGIDCKSRGTNSEKVTK